MATQSKTKRSTAVRKQSSAQHAKAGRQSHKNDNRKPSAHSGASSKSTMHSGSWNK